MVNDDDAVVGVVRLFTQADSFRALPLQEGLFFGHQVQVVAEDEGLIAFKLYFPDSFASLVQVNNTIQAIDDVLEGPL